ncbi:hypothetical protein QQP08_021472 [Theobroma cacao]|nr:hypothetical protein QQP08_021472 [Theobroma cacao]
MALSGGTLTYLERTTSHALIWWTRRTTRSMSLQLLNLRSTCRPLLRRTQHPQQHQLPVVVHQHDCHLIALFTSPNRRCEGGRTDYNLLPMLYRASQYCKQALAMDALEDWVCEACLKAVPSHST